MAAYAQYNGCGYPSANQYFSAGASLTTLHPIPQSPLTTTTSTHPPASISPPSNGRESNVSSSGGGEHNNSGTLTPDPTSQPSNNGTPSASGSANGSASGSTEPGCLSAYASSCPTIGGGGVMSNITISAPVQPLPLTQQPPATQHPPGTTSSLCCDNGRPVMTDPMTGQTVCSCQYDPTRLALSNYARMQSAAAVAASAGAQNPTAVGVYGTPYPSNEQNPYPSISVDSGPFYSSLSTPYGLKDGSCSGTEVTTWTSTGLPPSTGYYTYDPTFGAYGYGASYDLASRRKNATRESTATLKAWLSEHKKNPYPTKGEKIMLAIITKMTLTQVSTWFANARRRLKKENKMTWEPKNRTEDDDEDALGSDDEKQQQQQQQSHSEEVSYAERRRHDGLEYSSGAIGGVSLGNNQPASLSGSGSALTSTSAPAAVAAVAAVAATSATARVPDSSGVNRVGATISAAAVAAVVASTATGTSLHHHPHPHVGTTGAGANSVGATSGAVPTAKDLYQQTQQYSRNLFYNNNNISSGSSSSLHAHFPHLQQQQQHRHQHLHSQHHLQQQQQQQQSALSALSQHVAESAIWQQQQQQQQQRHHHHTQQSHLQ